MEDKTYEIKIPKTKKKGYVRTPYKSKTWFLRLIDFLDFGLPYKTWRQRWAFFVVSSLVILVYLFIVMTFPVEPIDTSVADPLSVIHAWLIVMFFYFFVFLVMCIPREVKSESFLFLGVAGTTFNGARTFRYCIIWVFWNLLINLFIGLRAEYVSYDFVAGITILFGFLGTPIGVLAILFFVAYDDALNE
jgi:hypothetical protein